MKRVLGILLTIIMVMTFSIGECMAAENPPKIDATTGILIDAHSGQVLWEKNAEVQMAPASMTKMMTAILAIENLDMDTVVTADDEMVYAGGSCIYMVKGEKFTVEQLLKAMMVGSENDCAVALAKTISGTVEDFANLMNGRAKEIGCTQTNFENPNGLDTAGHISTAHDMALIARELMKNEELRSIVKMEKYTIPKTNKSEKRVIEATNRMLWDKNTMIKVNGENRNPFYTGCIGIKTGYTDLAQACLASGAERDGTELIAVVMHTEDLDRFGDSIEVLDWGFANFTSHTVYERDETIGEVKVKGGKGGKIPTQAAYYVGGALEKGESKDTITTKVIYFDKIIAPKKAGDKVGVVQVIKSGEQIDEVDVVLSQDVEEGLFSFLYNGHVAHPVQLALFCLGILIVLFAIIILLLRASNKRKAKKRREARERKRAREEKYRNM